LLRIAESLDRSHKGVVKKAVFRKKNKGLVILEIHCARDYQLELWGAQKHTKVFNKTFTCSIDFDVIEIK
ncbi:Ppx/GppA family phosphatase, partial [Chloroflexota bacterium]